MSTLYQKAIEFLFSKGMFELTTEIKISAPLLTRNIVPKPSSNLLGPQLPHL